ncbi:MAG: hypothetical protein JWP08_3767 [Bryobacterales bacterium]|nr:hypothetical protein [Bryobacterales bacterium]
MYGEKRRATMIRNLLQRSFILAWRYSETSVESSRRNGCRSARLGEALLSDDKVSETEPYLSTQTLSMQTRPRTIRRSASLPGD